MKKDSLQPVGTKVIPFCDFVLGGFTPAYKQDPPHTTYEILAKLYDTASLAQGMAKMWPDKMLAAAEEQFAEDPDAPFAVRTAVKAKAAMKRFAEDPNGHDNEAALLLNKPLQHFLNAAPLAWYLILKHGTWYLTLDGLHLVPGTSHLGPTA